MAIDTKAILAKASELKSEMQKLLKSEMNNIFVDFWEQNPNINSIVWSQYAPYFNDGEPCVFSVRDVVFTNIKNVDLIQKHANLILYWEDYGKDEIADETDDEMDINDDTFAFSSYSAKRVISELNLNVNLSDIESISTFLESDLMSDIMEATFGSDALVVVNRDGFHTTEYYHD
jgi:hypothetical protein